MIKLSILPSTFSISLILQWTAVCLKDELQFKNVLIWDCEPQLKCVIDDTNARGFCGLIPIHSFLEQENSSFKYEKADFEDEQIAVWNKLCYAGYENSFRNGLTQNYKGSMENKLFGSAEFGLRKRCTDESSRGLVQYFTSIKEALDTYCTNGIQDIVGGMPSKCVEEETFSDESCGRSVSMKMVNYSHLTIERPQSGIYKVKVTKRSHFINLNLLLPEVNRKSIQYILNCCLRENILDHRYNLGVLVFTLPHLKSKLYVNEVNLNSLSRFTDYGSVLFVQNEAKRNEIITLPTKLLGILEEELIFSIDQKSSNKLYLELNSHIFNAVLVNWQKYETKSDLWHDSRQIYYNLVPKELSDYSHKFEKFVSNGVPYYPFPKSKVGFSFRDILNYSPEFQPKISLMLAAVHKSVIGIATNIEDFDYKSWFSQHFTEEWSNWVFALHTKGISQEDYLPLPIHPWQFTHYIERVFVDSIENEILVPLEVMIEVSPTSSFRTLLSMRNLSAPYIKLPVNIQATSVVRTYPPDVVNAASIFSQLMSNILASESSISEKLNILREDIGLYLNTTEENKAEHLSVTFRENVIGCCIRGEEIAVVIAALFEKLPPSNTSLFVHIMRFAGYTSLKGTLKYFTKYVDLVIGGYLDLYLIHGISLEGHQQNTLAVFENGLIKRFIARDLTGIEISDTVSKSHTLLKNITVSSRFKGSDFYVRIQLLQTVYQLHLGELLILLADHFSCSEKLFWDIIRDKTKERFEALKERMDNVRWKNEYTAILKADWPGISHLQNRLENVFERKSHHFFKNPLN